MVLKRAGIDPEPLGIGDRWKLVALMDCRLTDNTWESRARTEQRDDFLSYIITADDVDAAFHRRKPLDAVCTRRVVILENALRCLSATNSGALRARAVRLAFCFRLWHSMQALCFRGRLPVEKSSLGLGSMVVPSMRFQILSGTCLH